MYTAVLALTVYVGLLAVEQARFARFLLLGLLSGVATLVRPASAFIPAVPLLVVYLSDKRRWRFVLRASAVAAVGFILILAPWWARNYRLYGKPVLFSTGGGNPVLTATYLPGLPPAHVSVWPTSTSADELALTARWTGEAAERTVAQWRANPAGFIGKRTVILVAAAAPMKGHTSAPCSDLHLVVWLVHRSTTFRRKAGMR